MGLLYFESVNRVRASSSEWNPVLRAGAAGGGDLSLVPPCPGGCSPPTLRVQIKNAEAEMILTVCPIN